MRNGNLESPVQVTASEEAAISLLGGDLSSIRISLNSLKGSLINFDTQESSSWRFKHPTIGDAYASVLAKDPELLGIFIEGTSAERLVNQVTCGDIGFENSIVIGRNLFDNIIKKLDSWQQSINNKKGWSYKWNFEKNLHYFLANRCSKKFLEIYLKTHPDFIESIINPTPSLFFSSEINVVFSLSEANILPDQYRKKFIDTVVEHAMNGDDGFALESQKFRSFLSEGEFQELKLLLKERLVPNLSDTTIRHCSESFSDQSPEDHISFYTDLLDALKSEYSDDEETINIIRQEQDFIKNWVEEQDSEESDDHPTYRNLQQDPITSQLNDSERYFFEDVDR